MADIQVWKVVCDGLLVASLIYLCYRFARSSVSSLSPNAALMEAQLRALLKEADQTACMLNEKLLKRQGKIEELLFLLFTELRKGRSMHDFKNLFRTLRWTGRNEGNGPLFENCGKPVKALAAWTVGTDKINNEALMLVSRQKK